VRGLGVDFFTHSHQHLPTQASPSLLLFNQPFSRQPKALAAAKMSATLASRSAPAAASTGASSFPPRAPHTFRSAADLPPPLPHLQAARPSLSARVCRSSPSSTIGLLPRARPSPCASARRPSSGRPSRPSTGARSRPRSATLPCPKRVTPPARTSTFRPRPTYIKASRKRSTERLLEPPAYTPAPPPLATAPCRPAPLAPPASRRPRLS